MSYQQMTIVGRLGRDPEMRYTAAGVPVTSFSVAVSKRWKSEDRGQQEKTVWFRVSAWRKLAETTAEHLTKGREVLVIGEIEEPNIWTDKDGNSRSNLELTAKDIRFLGSKSDGQGSNPKPIQKPKPAAQVEEDIPF